MNSHQKHMLLYYYVIPYFIGCLKILNNIYLDSQIANILII